MVRPRAREAWLLAALLVVAACGGAATEDTPPPTEAPTTTGGAPTTGPPTETTAGPTDSFALDCSPVDYEGDPVTLSFVWWRGGGDSPTDIWIDDSFACFEEKYGGKITLDIEFVPGPHDYVTKLQSEYATTGELPIVVVPKLDPNLAVAWLENDELVDLTPYFEADPDWQAIAIEASLDLNTIDGKLVASPDSYQTAVGYFYNTTLFEQAGVTEIPDDWDGFFAMLDQLKAAGIPALSLHTEDTAWTPILMYEALIARTPEGRDFLNAVFPSDFNQPFLIDATRDLARLFEYATPDAIGANFPLAANNFLAERTAIIANGPWMIGDFRDPEKAAADFGDRVGVSLFPGPFAVDDTGRQLGDYAIAKGHPQEMIDAAAELIKWMSGAEVTRQRVIRLGSVAPNLDLSEGDLALLDPLAADLINQVQQTGAPILPNYQGQWNSIVYNEAIQQELPQLALGNITPEEFLQLLTDAAVEGNPADIPPWVTG